jgi:hypothetical protein
MRRVLIQNIAARRSGNNILTRRIWGSHRGGYKSSIVWDMTPRSPLKANRRFGGTCRLHPQGRIRSQGRNQLEADSKPNPKQNPNEKPKLKMAGDLFSVLDSSTSTLNLSFNWLRAVMLCLLPALCQFLVWHVLRPWGWRRHVPPKGRLIFNRLHGFISQKVNSSIH